MSDPFNFGFGDVELSLWNDSFAEITGDRTAQALYHEAYFNKGVWEPDELSAIRQNLQSYLMDEYGLDFDAEFDWDTWRETYSDA